MYWCADGHIDINGELFQPGVTEARSEALKDTVGFFTRIRQAIQVIVIMHRILAVGWRKATANNQCCADQDPAQKADNIQSAQASQLPLALAAFVDRI